jgi:hypothetical protein
MRIVFSSMVIAGIALAGASSAVVAQGGKPAPVTIEQHAATMKTIAQNAQAFNKSANGGDTAAAMAAADVLHPAQQAGGDHAGADGENGRPGRGGGTEGRRRDEGAGVDQKCSGDMCAVPQNAARRRWQDRAL